MAARTAASPGAPTTKLGTAAYELDDRMIIAPWLRRTLNKVSPPHCSFLPGELPLSSFLTPRLAGPSLTFFSAPWGRGVFSAGTSPPGGGVGVPPPSAPALRLSFDAR